MKTPTEYLSGKHDEELNGLVAEARQWKRVWNCHRTGALWMPPDYEVTPPDELAPIDTPMVIGVDSKMPLFSTSRDACEELLADLSDEKFRQFMIRLYWIIIPNDRRHPDHFIDWDIAGLIFRATARQICVAYLIVKEKIK